MIDEANNMNVPVVNIQWLNDMILGTISGTVDTQDSKYQNFDLLNPFSTNFEMASKLLGTVLRSIYVFLFSPKNII